MASMTAIGLFDAKPAQVIHVRNAQMGDVYVGRRSARIPRGMAVMPVFGNPFRLQSEADRDRVIEQYQAYLLRSPAMLRALPALRGKRLACWCAPKRCHADVLAETLKRCSDDELRAMADALEAVW